MRQGTAAGGAGAGRCGMCFCESRGGCTVEVNSHLGFDAVGLYQMGDKYSLATATGSLTHSWQCPGNLVRQREETFGMYYFVDSRVLWCII